MAKRTLYGTVIVTYRCNAHCNMCDCFRDPTKPEEEITLDIIKKLPEMAFTNITGGEPFIRKDIPEIVTVDNPWVFGNDVEARHDVSFRSLDASCHESVCV